MNSKLNLSFLIFISMFCASCSHADLSIGFNWLMKISGLFAALGAVGHFYFENKVKEQELKAKDDFSKQHVIDVGSNNYKEWLVEKDSPIILEALDVVVNFSFQAHLEKGDSFNVHKFQDWDLGGANPFLEFQRKWENNLIPLNQLTGIIDSPFTKFQVTDINKKLVYRPLNAAIAHYIIRKTFYLTNTNSLPNSKTISNFGSKNSKQNL